jgi:hypothetical protein
MQQIKHINATTTYPVMPGKRPISRSSFHLFRDILLLPLLEMKPKRSFIKFAIPWAGSWAKRFTLSQSSPKTSVKASTSLYHSYFGLAFPSATLRPEATASLVVMARGLLLVPRPRRPKLPRRNWAVHCCRTCSPFPVELQKLTAPGYTVVWCEEPSRRQKGHAPRRAGADDPPMTPGNPRESSTPHTISRKHVRLVLSNASYTSNPWLPTKAYQIRRSRKANRYFFLFSCKGKKKV